MCVLTVCMIRCVLPEHVHNVFVMQDVSVTAGLLFNCGFVCVCVYRKHLSNQRTVHVKQVI